MQSFGYCRYLPLGRPEILVENLDRWGADEILVQCIDRSAFGLGPDLELLYKISEIGVSTPLIYAGGIGGPEDAVKVINCGADRIMVDAMLWNAPRSLESVARELGTQALIAHLPLRMSEGVLNVLNYRDKFERPLENWLEHLPHEWFSEVMITDWLHEGSPGSFDERLLTVAKQLNKPLLCFGGISEVAQIQTLLAHNQVVAAGIGNFLNYKEHAVQALKKQLSSAAVRLPHYEGRR